MTDGLGHTTRYVVNDARQVVAEIDPLGAVTRSERDRYNRCCPRTDPLGRTHPLPYDEHGQPDRRDPPRRPRGDRRVQRSRLPVRVTDPDGDSRPPGPTTSAATALGRPTRRRRPRASPTTRRGHLTSVTDALGTRHRVVCDAAGLPLEVTDPLGAITRYERDAFGRPVAITDPLGRVTRLEWTVEGQLSRRTAPDGATRVLDLRRRGQLPHPHRRHGRRHPLRVHPLRPAHGPHRPGRRPLRVRPRHRTPPHPGHQPAGPDLELRLRRRRPPDHPRRTSTTAP